MDFSLQLSVLLLLLLIVRSNGGNRVRPRRQTTTAFSLQELKDECCDGIRWRKCCKTATALSRNDSPRNKNFQRCRTEAQNEILDNEGIPIDTGNSDFQQEYFTEATGSRCPISRNERAAARVEYCSQLVLIHFVMFGKSNNYLKNLTKACVCAQRNARSNAHPSRPNSHAVVLNMVKDWHRDMVQKHRSPKNCCNESIFAPPPEPAPTKPVLLTCSSDDSRVYCDNNDQWDDQWDDHWDINLANVARAMRMVEMLESLGRRTTCVRGCVGESEVKCANIITGN